MVESPTATPSEIGKQRWVIVFMMLLIYGIMYLCRTSLSIAGPTMMNEFGWSPAQFGLASTGFFLGYAITMLPAGWLSDKFGTTVVLVVGVLWWSVFMMVAPTAGTMGVVAFIVARAAMGLGQAAVLPANAAMIAQWIPKKESALAQGVVMIGTPLGITLTYAIAPTILEGLGWRFLFYFFACLGPIWLVAWYFLGKSKPEDHPRVTKEELDYIRSDRGGVVTNAAGVTSEANAEVTARQVFRTPAVWVVAISYFTSNYLFFMFMTWLPTYFDKGRGLSLSGSAYLSTIPYIVAMFCYPLGGLLADWAAKKWGHNAGRKLFPIIGLAGAGAFLIFGTQASTIVGAVTLISISNGLLSVTQAPFFSMPLVFSRIHAAKITGLNGFCGTVGGIIAPMMTGFIVQATGYDQALYVGAGVAVLGALVLLFGSPIKEITPEKI